MSDADKLYVCPCCGGPVKFSHKDDVGVEFWKCTKCGRQTSKPLKAGVSSEESHLEKPEKVCGDCAYWYTEKCPFLDDVKKGLLKRTDEACGEYYPKQKEKTPSKTKGSQADTLVQLCLSKNPELFYDQHQMPYARIEQEGVKQNITIKSKRFKTWLAKLLYDQTKKAPSNETLNSALNVLKAIALFEGHEYRLYNRVAPAADGFWIDMCDKHWRAIKVTGHGWSIINDPPILFRRYSHQKPLPTPQPGGNPWKLLEYINVGDEATKLTLLVAAVSSFIPRIPHVILVFYGIQGSGKTTALKLIRALIDPSAIDVLSIPRKEQERVQQLDHHWCAYYDNITRLPNSISDTFCRAATGGGFTKRELYTDDEDIIYNFKRCLGLSGINIAAQRGDLLDRSLLVGLKNIPTDQRKTEKELLTEFEKDKPEILGGFLDTLVKAIQLYPHVNTPRLFRMADFTRWGCAITMALGKSEQEFLDAYEEKVKKQIEEAALDTPLAHVLMDWMIRVENGEWEGTPSELYQVLRRHAKFLGVSRRQKHWPKAPNALTRQLNELTPSLEQLGYNVETGIRTKEGRIVRVTTNTVKSVKTDNKHTIEHIKIDGIDGVADISSYSKGGSPLSTLDSSKSILEVVRSRFPRKFAQVEFLKLTEERGWSDKDAQALLRKLVENGKVLKTTEGMWVWV